MRKEDVEKLILTGHNGWPEDCQRNAAGNLRNELVQTETGRNNEKINFAKC